MRRLFPAVAIILLLVFVMAVICYADTNTPVTRAEFASILVNAVNGRDIPDRVNAPVAPPVFSDVREGDEHYGAIMSAADKGYISGYPDGTFRPDEPIAFEQMVTMTSALLQMAADTDPGEILSGYTDGSSVSPYAAPYIAENIKRSYINIDGDLIHPGRTVDNSEAESYVSGVLSENIAYGLNIPDGTTQLILVTAGDYGVNAGRTRLYSKDKNGVWQNIINFDCYIGAAGFSDSKMLEGHNNTPVGLFTIGTVFGTGDNPGTNMEYRKIQPDDVWVDDPESEFYNTWQKRGDNNGQWNSAENMDISAYALGFVIDYNTEERIPYAGSAFFFHIYNEPTQGCVGTSRANVLKTVKWLEQEQNPMILMCPVEELTNFENNS